MLSAVLKMPGKATTASSLTDNKTAPAALVLTLGGLPWAFNHFVKWKIGKYFSKNVIFSVTALQSLSGKNPFFLRRDGCCKRCSGLWSSSGLRFGYIFRTLCVVLGLCCVCALCPRFVMIILTKLQCLFSASAATWRTHSTGLCGSPPASSNLGTEDGVLGSS